MTATMDRTAQGTGVAGRLSDILSPLVGGELPVRLTAWDGSTAGPEDAPKVTLYSRMCCDACSGIPASWGGLRRRMFSVNSTSRAI